MAKTQKLALDKKWAITPAEATAKLKSKLVVRPLRGTDLIEIRSRDEDAELAAQIADAVADSYRTRLDDTTKRQRDAVLATLEKQIGMQQKKADTSRKFMLEIMERYNIADLSIAQPQWITVAEDHQQKTTKGTLDRLEGWERIEAAIDLGLPNAVLKKRYPDVQKLRGSRKELLDSGLNTEHPKVVAFDRQLEQLQHLLLDAIKVELAAPKTAKVPEIVVEKDSLQARRQNIVYIESKKDYELNKEVLNSMQAMLAKQKIDARGINNQVIIHERAAIPQAPTRPAGTTHPIAIGGSVFDGPNDLADPRSTDPDARTPGVGFRFVLADGE